MISVCLVKTTGAVTALTPTTAYKIYTGALGSESDSGYTVVPSAVSRVNLEIDTWCVLIAVNNGWELVAPGAGGGGGGGTNTALYFATIHTGGLDKSEAGANVDGLISMVSGIPDVVGTTFVFNPWGQHGIFGADALVGKDTTDGLYYFIRVFEREETLECTVYADFAKTNAEFLAVVLRSYNGYTADGSQILVYNQEDPYGDKPYLFEGERNAVCRVQYDNRSQRFRVVWVECPDQSPVPEAGGGESASAFNFSQWGEAAAAGSYL